ncbi:MAG: thiamine pyrophosphate-dependent enzyme [Planctomycetota bacterium]|nr:thiamine pyrophosphate-dependent enzyme [Planctomycetota bacterium]
MKQVFKFPDSLYPVATHYCPGCGHGVLHRIVAETLDELGVAGKTVGIAPVGCSVLIYNYIKVDMLEAAHGRAPAIATGIKRASPDTVVFTYQGDGDLAAIGTGELIHTASRGENVTTIFINNAIYGMTGGQMAPTTMIGQKTTTTPAGRSLKNDGPPVRVCELLSSLEGVVYLERVMVGGPVNARKIKRAVKKAFQTQLAGRGYALVEVLSPCPVGWGLSPQDAVKYVADTMTKVFPPGVFKDWERKEEAKPADVAK